MRYKSETYHTGQAKTKPDKKNLLKSTIKKQKGSLD